MSDTSVALGPEETVQLGDEEPVVGDDLGVVAVPKSADVPHEDAAIVAELRARVAARSAGQAPPDRSPNLIAFRAQNAGVDGAAAAESLGLAKQTGLAPQFVADRLGEVRQQKDQQALAASLSRAPITGAYASQSAVHAAAVKPDVGLWEALEQGFSDVGYGVIATEQMSLPSAQGDADLQGYEQATGEFDQRKSGWAADLARAAPSLALYFLAGKAGEVAGGKPGEFATTAATMYAMNRGVLYRRIMQQMPIPASDAEGDYDPEAYEARARQFATAGGIASAALGAGLSSAISLAVPGAAQKIQGVSTALLSRVFTDPVTSAVVNNLTSIGGKTLSGALMMAVPAAVDAMTVSKAATGEIDWLGAGEAGWNAFKSSLLAAGLLSAVGHGPQFLHDVGAARSAPADIARLDAQVETAKKIGLVKSAPEEAQQLVAQQAAQGSASTVYIDHEAASRPEVARQLVETLADEGQALAEAKATQSEVPVPVEKYVTELADLHPQIREDVKTDPEGVTLRQANDVADELTPAPGGVVKRDLSDILDNDVPIAKLTGNELDELPRSDRGRLKPAELTKWLREQIFGTYLNGHTKWAIDVAARGAKEVASQNNESVKAAPAIPQMLLDAVLHHSEPDVKGRRDVRASHMLYAPVEVGDQLYRAGIRVNETQEGFKLYNVHVEEMEHPASIVNAAGTNESGKQLGPPGTIKVRDLIAGVKEPEPPASGGGGGSGGDGDAGGKPQGGEPMPGPGPDHSGTAHEIIEAKTIGEIQPGRYELAARRAEDRLAEMAKGSAASASKPGQEINATVKMAKTADLETARDLSRAIAKRAGEVSDEMQKAASYIDSRNTPDAIAALAKSGPEYAAAFRNIAAMVNGQPGVNASSLDALLGRMSNEGHLVGFDEVGLRELLDEPKPWRELTPPEARNIVDAVKNLRFSAARVNEIARADRVQTLRDFVGSVSTEAGSRKDLGSPPITDSAAASIPDRIARTAGMFNAANLKPETIFTQLGETAHRFFEESIIGARNYKAELQGEHLKYFLDNFDKQLRGLNSWLRERVKTSLTIPRGVDLDGTRVNKETLAMAFLNLGTESNEQRLLSGYQWDGGQVRQEIGKSLTREQLDFLQGVLKYNDEKIWPLVKAHAESQTGVAPPKMVAQKIRVPLADGTTWEGEGGYFPAAPNRRALGIPDRMAEGVQQVDPAVRATVAASFTKTRSEQASYPVDLNWSRYPAHLASVFHYLAYDRPVQDMGKLLRDQEFQYTARHFVGDEKLQQLKEDNKVWASGTAAGANNIAVYIDQLFARVLRSRAISNALAFSTPIALGQESHIQYAIASGQISLKSATAAMTRQMPWMDAWTATRAISDEVRLRSDRYADQFREAISGQPAKTLLGHGLDRAAFAQMEAADSIISHVIFDAAMNDALGRKMSTEDAVTEGNRKVRLLMPSHNPLEMAPIVRSRGTIGALMLFRGLPNVTWNVESGLYDQALQQASSASGAKQLARAGGRIALNTARAWASLAVLHMLGRLWMGHGKKDEDGEGIDGWATWAEREAIASQFSRLPLGRDVMEPIIDAVQHDKPIAKAIEDIRVAPDLAVVQNIVKDLGKIGSDSTVDEDRVQASVNTALTLLGTGARQLTRTGRYLYDLQQGNVDARGPGDVAGGVVYGQRPGQEKNIPVAAQDLVSGE